MVEAKLVFTSQKKYQRRFLKETRQLQIKDMILDAEQPSELKNESLFRRKKSKPSPSCVNYEPVVYLFNPHCKNEGQPKYSVEL